MKQTCLLKIIGMRKVSQASGGPSARVVTLVPPAKSADMKDTCMQHSARQSTGNLPNLDGGGKF